jgi:hypothetical protein
MNLNLLVPNLFWPDSSQTEIYHELSAPSLEALLSKSTATMNPPQEIEAWLCKEFNVAKHQNDWPIAPLMLHTDAPALAKTSKDFWMRADPVHLRIEQNHIMLADSQAFKISIEEAEQMVQDLNHNLGNHNLSFFPSHPDRWYIRTPKTPEIFTHTLSHVTCKNINNFLPSGAESIVWHRIFNEIQMLLYEHPVNQARESRGELAINSVWFWGGGNMPQSAQSPYTHIWSDNDLPRALALASNTDHSRLPADAQEWFQTQISGNHLVVLDALQGKAKYRNAYAWREALVNMEKNWFLPVYTALKKGKINQLTITALNETSSQRFEITRSDLWKFWRITKPLSAHIETH